MPTDEEIFRAFASHIVNEKPTKQERIRAALADPEILALLRKDPKYAQYFDAEGCLLVDTSGLTEDGNRRAQR